MSIGRCYIGTSGWSYTHWAKGCFYPAGLKQAEWLPYLAARLATVEINSSFYRPPRAAHLQRWYGVVGPDFRFAAKLWRWFTHDKRLLVARDRLRPFMDLLAELKDKRGPLLIQLPPYLERDVARLDRFLHELRYASPIPWRVVVEFRHPSWLTDDVLRVLDQHSAALCLSDMPYCLITESNDAPFVYIRRHGPIGPYAGCYLPDHLAADAARIRAWQRAGRDVHIYYNNDVAGHAVANALDLRKILEPDQDVIDGA